MASLAEILTRYWPGAEWTIDGDDYDTLVWHGPGVKPTEASIRTHTDEVNIDIVEIQTVARQQRSFIDRPDAILIALDRIIDGELMLKNKLDDLITKLAGAAVAGGKASLDPYDSQKLSRLAALRQKIDDIRSS